MPAMPNAIIVDIDGTISNYTHRKHYLASMEQERHNDQRPQYDDFNRAALHDEPIKEVLSIVQWAHAAGDTKIILMTGRSNRYRDITTQWLAAHRVRYDRLFMREQGDYRSDTVAKKELYMSHVAGKYNVLFVLEDRDKVVEMWRDLGLRCLQVATGE
jgi:uncharacterized HAD superfamily protein